MKLLHITFCLFYLNHNFISFTLGVEEKPTHLRGLQYHNINRNNKDSRDIQRALSSDILNKFKIEHDLKLENDLSLQIVNNNSVNVRGTVYLLDRLTRVNVFTKEAACYDDDVDVTQDCVTDSNSFVGKQGNKTIFMTKDANRNIQTIKILHEDGSETNLAAVAENIMASYEEEDIDEDKLSKFSLYGDIVNQSITDNPEHRKLLPIEMREKYESPNLRALLSEDCTSFKIIETAIVYDSTFCIAEGGAANARDTIENIIAGASIYYQQQGACMKLELKHLEGFCEPNNDPFKAGMQTGNIGCSSGKVGLLDSFMDWWENKRANVQKDAAHLFFNFPFTGPDSNIVGCAMTWGMYGSFDNGYGAESMDFSHDLGRRTTLFSHELGHNLGLGHTRNSDGNKYIMHSGTPTWGHHIWHPNDLTVFDSYLHLFPTLHEEPASGNGSTDSSNPQVTLRPNPQPTLPPTLKPTPEPPQKSNPTKTLQPTPQPTSQPTIPPTIPPTTPPTSQPTPLPTPSPSPQPSPMPSLKPTLQPTLQPSPSQRLTRKPTPQPTTRPTLHSTGGENNGLMIKVTGDLCLTVQNGVVDEGIEPILSKCVAGNANQSWLMDSSGQLRSILVNNKCIHPRSFMYGTSIEFDGCSTNRRQQWELQDNGRMKNAVHRHLCLTANDEGQAAYIWPCWLENDQFWTVV